MPRECVVKLVLEIFKSNNLVNLSKELDESIYKTFFLYAELCNTLLDQDRDANERWKTFTNSDDLKSLIDKHFCNLDLFDALVRSGIIVLEGTRAAFLNLFSYKHFLWVMRKRKYRNKLSQLGLKEKRAISSSTKSVDDANLTSTIASEKELLALYNRKLQEEAQGNHKFTKRKEDRKPLASPPAQCNVNATNMVSHTVRDTPPVLSHTVRDTCNNGQSVRIVTPAQRNTTPPKGMSHTVRDTPPVLSHTVRDTCHERSKKSVVTPELPYSDPPKVCLTQCVTQPPFCLTQCVTQAENRLEDPRPADFASERADLRKESERERKKEPKKERESQRKEKEFNIYLDINTNTRQYVNNNTLPLEVNTNSAHARAYNLTSNPKYNKATLDTVLNKLDNQNEKQQNNNLAEQKIENANGHKADSLFPEMHEIITIGKTQIDLSKIDFPENCKTEEIKQAIIDWLTYRSKIKKPYKCPEQQISLLLKEFKSDFPKCVNNSIANGYQGCFPPRKSKNEIDYYAL